MSAHGAPPATAATAATAAAGGRRRVVLELGRLRAAGAAMLAAGLVLRFAPGAPGVACPLRALTGVPCPLCGTTRSVVAAVSGRWADAVALNPAGPAAVVVAAVLLAVRRPPRPAVAWWVPAVGVGALWAYQLWRAPAL